MAEEELRGFQLHIWLSSVQGGVAAIFVEFLLIIVIA